jgi:hypothetical protein
MLLLKLAIQRGFWLVIVASTFCVYLAKPLWPVTVSHFQWQWPASVVCFVALGTFAFYTRHIRFWPLVGLSLLALMFYFVVEGMIWTLLFVELGYLSHPEDAPFIGFINLLANIPAIAVFVALQAVRFLLAVCVFNVR